MEEDVEEEEDHEEDEDEPINREIKINGQSREMKSVNSNIYQFFSVYSLQSHHIGSFSHCA